MQALRSLLGGVLLSCALAAPSAIASPDAAPPDFDALMASAVAARDEGDLERTAELLEQAYAVQPLPALLNNLGKVYEELGRYAAAHDAYRRVVDDPRAAADLRSLDAGRMAALQPKIERGWLDLRVAPGGAEVLLDGASIAAGGGEQAYPPGPHLLEIGQPGSVELLVRRLELPAGERVTRSENLATPPNADGLVSLTGLPAEVERLGVGAHWIATDLSRLRALRVAEGSWTFRARTRAGRTVEVPLTVTAGEDVALAGPLAEALSIADRARDRLARPVARLFAITSIDNVPETRRGIPRALDGTAIVLHSSCLATARASLIRPALALAVRLHGEPLVHAAEVVAIDDATDTAVLAIYRDRCPAVAAEDAAPGPADEVMVVGFPVRTDSDHASLRRGKVTPAPDGSPARVDAVVGPGDDGALLAAEGGALVGQVQLDGSTPQRRAGVLPAGRLRGALRQATAGDALDAARARLDGDAGRMRQVLAEGVVSVLEANDPDRASIFVEDGQRARLDELRGWLGAGGRLRPAERLIAAMLLWDQGLARLHDDAAAASMDAAIAQASAAARERPVYGKSAFVAELLRSRGATAAPAGGGDGAASATGQARAGRNAEPAEEKGSEAASAKAEKKKPDDDRIVVIGREVQAYIGYSFGIYSGRNDQGEKAMKTAPVNLRLGPLLPSIRWTFLQVSTGLMYNLYWIDPGLYHGLDLPLRVDLAKVFIEGHVVRTFGSSLDNDRLDGGDLDGWAFETRLGVGIISLGYRVLPAPGEKLKIYDFGLSFVF